MSSACLYPAHISGADLSGFLEITFVDLLGSDNQEIDLKNVRTGKTAKVACYVFSNSTSTQSSNEISLRFDLVYEGTQQTKKINFTVKDVNINKSLLIKGIKLKIISKNLISATYEKGSLDLREMINYLNQNEIKIEDISTEEGDLEDVFVQLTKH